MAFANPALNERVFDKEMGDGTQAGWASPTGPAAGTTTADAPAPPAYGAPPQGAGAGFGGQPPVGYGGMRPSSSAPFETTDGKVMTTGGTFTATLVLFALLLVGGWFGWSRVNVTSITNQVTGVVSYNINIPGWIWIASFATLGLAFLTIFKPKLARITGPIYAVGEGVVLGAISAAFNAQYNGIVLQAVLATLAVFATMLFLYATRLIKVTERFRRITIFAMIGILVLYLVSFVAQAITGNVAFINQPTVLGIGLSVVIVIVASMNLMLNFDFVERAVTARAPKYMEWYGAFGLMIALVWLYLEILRLLALLRSR
jgi:uncharacterized YccA/Bax inhibitor family protein